MNSDVIENTGELQTRSLALAETATCPMWLAPFRARAQRELAAAPFPQRKSESWKYTSPQALLASGALNAVAPAGYCAVPDEAMPALDAWRVVFVNGRFDAAQSRLPDDDSIVISSLIKLEEREQARAQDLFGLDDHTRLPFATLNDTLFADGLYVRVRKNRRASKPLHVVFHSDSKAAAIVATRLLVALDEQSELTLIEQYSCAGNAVLTNAATTIDLARDARLVHIRVQVEASDSMHIGALHLCQQAGSRCDGFQLMTGSRLKRNDVTVNIAGPGAELALKGAYLVNGGEHVDNQVCIQHTSPQGTSDQVFRGIVGGDGKAVFNGRIHIHPGARGTSAELVNNNLLLSPDAEVDTKPELEIYNDDVKCAHGATVGQLNETGVYYLRSRGIAKADAELMLSLGFINALIDAVPDEALSAWLRGVFAQRFVGRDAVSSGATP